MEESPEAIYPERNTLDHLAMKALEEFHAVDMYTELHPRHGEITEAYFPETAAEEFAIKAAEEYGMTIGEFAVFIAQQSGYTPNIGGLDNDINNFSSFDYLFETIAKSVILQRMKELVPKLEDMAAEKDEKVDKYYKKLGISRYFHEPIKKLKYTSSYFDEEDEDEDFA